MGLQPLLTQQVVQRVERRANVLIPIEGEADPQVLLMQALQAEYFTGRDKNPPLEQAVKHAAHVHRPNAFGPNGSTASGQVKTQAGPRTLMQQAGQGQHAILQQAPQSGDVLIDARSEEHTSELQSQ